MAELNSSLKIGATTGAPLAGRRSLEPLLTNKPMTMISMTMILMTISTMNKTGEDDEFSD